MKLDHTLTYDGTPEAVFTILSDPDYVEEKCWATGATEAGVSVEEDGDDVVIRTVRTYPAQVPSYVRTVVGDSITADQTETWGPPAEDGSRDGTVAIDFTGTPMKVRGTLRLEAGDGEALTTMVVSGDLKAGIPFVGGKIEGFTSGQLVRAMNKEAEVANAHLV
ncbi:MAG TPA: DUF2505 domain-containing protein [Candidatus Limnocylindria bacterium]|nr:DUF2505 domain-containing protein [Candidatus Limnocylindria bacterium]